MLLGLGSLAAPVFDHAGKVVAAINISGLSIQILHEEKVGNIIEELVNSARTISIKLGYIQEKDG
jgi:DNA-binding IclR family transcriptional regulator